MKRLLSLVLLLATTPAQADRRVESRAYHADQVFSVTGHPGVQTMIEFSPDEHIENIALGDSSAWQVTPNKRANLIFLKPLSLRAHTNMTVVTDRRRYLFDLVNGGTRARPLYALRFSYPDEERAALAAAAQAAMIAAAPPPAAPPPAPVLNTRWEASGERRLIPARIYDDGASTYLAWADTTELPAVLVRGSDGVEGPVNFTVRGDMLVIEGVAPLYVLRIGKASAVLTNLAPRPPKLPAADPAP